MENLRISVLVAALVIQLSGCNVVPYHGTISAYMISGQVVDFDTGKPIAGVAVCARYAKLDAHFYVRGETQTDLDGRFKIPANPERVVLLDSPNAAQTPSLSFLHPDYASTMALLRNFDRDKELKVRLHPLSKHYIQSLYIDCSSSGKRR